MQFTVGWNSRRPEGFLNTRWGAQLTDDTDSYPTYVETTGAYLKMEPAYDRLPTVTATLSNLFGSTNPKKFRGEKNNYFYLRVVLPYSIPSKSVMTLNVPEV